MIAADHVSVSLEDLFAPGSRTFQKIMRYVMSKGLQNTDAEDVAQETALRLLIYLRKYPDRFFGEQTVIAIAKRCVANERRRRSQKRNAITSFPGLHAIRQPETDQSTSAPTRTELERRLVCVNAAARDIVIHCLLDRDSVADIAESMQLTKKAVRARLDRIRRKFTPHFQKLETRPTYGVKSNCEKFHHGS